MIRATNFLVSLVIVLSFVGESSFAQEDISQTDSVLEYKKTLDGNSNHLVYQVDTSDTPMEKLQKQRINAGLAAIDSVAQRVAAGDGDIVQFGDLHNRITQAKLEFHTEPVEKLAVLENALKTAEQMEENRIKRFNAGLSRPDDAALASMFRVEIEIQLERLKESMNRK